MTALWRYTDMLVFSSRADELDQVLYQDLIHSTYRSLFTLQATTDEMASECQTDNSLSTCDSLRRVKQAQRVQRAASEAERHVESLLSLRTQRLNTEGEGVPPAIFTILDSLSVYILVSYVVLSSARSLEPIAGFNEVDLPWSISSSGSSLHSVGSISGMMVNTANAVASSPSIAALTSKWHLDIEALLFAVLASMLLVVRTLYRDLDRPFRGHAQIRRTVTSNSIRAIRKDIEQALLSEEMESIAGYLQGCSERQAKTRATRVVEQKWDAMSGDE
mmetsp:Transcript_38337/g.62321  ORF Transcript_38337/g.62321 Transcript_38337/m.62321 type:complete len:276 (+) Transcript_38337:1202-2029(+)